MRLCVWKLNDHLLRYPGGCHRSPPAKFIKITQIIFFLNQSYVSKLAKSNLFIKVTAPLKYHSEEKAASNNKNNKPPDMNSGGL